MFLDKLRKTKKKAEPETEIYAPVSGEVIPLSEVNDPTFAEGLIGPGVAVIPSADEVCSPVDGEVVTIFPTKHAIGIMSTGGVELLLHLGIDTVMLEGQFYQGYVGDGSKVKKGDLLVKYDRAAIQEAGYDPVLMMMVTNTGKNEQIMAVQRGSITQGDKILNIIR